MGITYNDVERAVWRVLNAHYPKIPPARRNDIAGKVAGELAHLTDGYVKGKLLCACNRWWVSEGYREYHAGVVHGYDDCKEQPWPLPPRAT